MTGAPKGPATLPAPPSVPAEVRQTESPTEPDARDVLEALSAIATRLERIETKVNEGIAAIREDVATQGRASVNAMLNLERSVDGLRESVTKDVGTLFRRTDKFQRLFTGIAESAAAE